MVMKIAIGLLAAAAALGHAATEASAADKVVWNLSAFGSPRAVTKGMEEIARYVTEKSGGNFTIRIGWGETLSPAKENLDAVKIGAVEAAQFCAAYAPGKVPVHTVLDLPFLPISTLDEMEQVHEAFHAHPLAVKEMETWSARVLFVSLLSNHEFMGAGPVPANIEDWKGMRVRALGGAGDAMSRLGAVPTSVPAPEVYTGLERGVFTAVLFPFPDSFGTFRLHEVSKWYTQGLGMLLPTCPIIINLQSYQALPAEFQKILFDAKPSAYQKLKQSFAEAYDKWLPVFQKAGLQELRISPEMRNDFVERAARPVWNDWVAEMNQKGYDGQALLDFVLAEARKAHGS